MQTRKQMLAFISILLALWLGFATPSFAVPSYARQTGLACQACHTVFPELTPQTYLP